jgi:hypothetical protein
VTKTTGLQHSESKEIKHEASSPIDPGRKGTLSRQKSSLSHRSRSKSNAIGISNVAIITPLNNAKDTSYGLNSQPLSTSTQPHIRV